MTGCCGPAAAQVAVALFAAAHGEHWCTEWRSHTRSDGTRVIWCMHRVAVQLEVAA